MKKNIFCSHGRSVIPIQSGPHVPVVPLPVETPNEKKIFLKLQNQPLRSQCGEYLDIKIITDIYDKISKI